MASSNEGTPETDTDFDRRVFDYLPGNVVVLDQEGTILQANREWNNFGCENGLDLSLLWEGVNYFDGWTESSGDAEYTHRAREGIHELLEGDRDRFGMEYPCHGPDERRWFFLQARAFEHRGERGVIVVHLDITERWERETRLEHRATHDLLTGLSDREAFMEALDQELERARRYEYPVSVIMVDLDRFKRVNDTHGHLTGDNVLRDLGTVLTDTLRTSDLPARYGGEEFILMLPEAGETEARDTAERLRRTIEAHAFPLPDEDDGITASMGWAAVTDGGEDPESLIERADRALYRAKERGRNRVETV